MNEIHTQDITAWLDQQLKAAQFKDYCPNGLQVEGKTHIRRIVCGVTASEALLRAAIDLQADGVLVHHGWFWRGEDPRVRGSRRTRMALALLNELNIWGYHLPLDAHPTLGNNAMLADRLGLIPARGSDGAPQTFGPDNLMWSGTAPGIATLDDLAARVAQVLDRTPLCIGDPAQPIKRVAWCTGGAQGMFGDAVDAGVDAYITGEASEQTTHLAREAGVGFIGAGHHATERYGVQALGQALAAHFGIDVSFIDIDNPV